MDSTLSSRTTVSGPRTACCRSQRRTCRTRNLRRRRRGMSRRAALEFLPLMALADRGVRRASSSTALDECSGTLRRVHSAISSSRRSVQQLIKVVAALPALHHRAWRPAPGDPQECQTILAHAGGNMAVRVPEEVVGEWRVAFHRPVPPPAEERRVIGGSARTLQPEGAQQTRPRRSRSASVLRPGPPEAAPHWRRPPHLFCRSSRPASRLRSAHRAADQSRSD